METDDTKATAHAETVRIQQSCTHFSTDSRGQCEACGFVLYSEELEEKAHLAWRKFMDSDLED